VKRSALSRTASLERGAFRRREAPPAAPDGYVPALPKPVRAPKDFRPLRAKKPINRTNPARKAAKFARNFGEHRAFIVGLPCAVRLKPSCRENPWRIVPAHVRAIGMGAAKGTWRDLVPLSHDLHMKQHRLGVRGFEETFGISLRALRHVLVVADPVVSIEEQLIAWRLLHQEHSEAEITAALQRGFDLTGFPVEPPRAAEEVERG
jgi:hypothetical protein